ncbi:MAG: bifunctional riboflavin kinase/FAD synthetase [Alphaproteobacteria bacterium]|nr:bifunctional riboflavin kinase/FAD synthetase [Alphaproteobacteria bacterium]
MTAAMERLDGGSAVPAALRGGVVALGNFDGVHKGHQAVIGRAVERARAEGRPALVATFDPHPMRFFRPDSPWFRLTTMDQRARLLEAAGVDAMFVFRFDRDFAALTPEQFVTDWLVERIGAAGIVTGEDFTFGRNRGGDVALLAAFGERLGFSTDVVPPVRDESGIVSSSRIREALRAGDCGTAARLLTRPFAIEGVVEHGDKRGRAIGYPTANLGLDRYLRPRFGIYAVRGTLEDGRMLDGAANLGIRPSFAPPKELLEPFFFDFSGDLYGRKIEVALISFLRPEAKFDTIEALQAQMARDCDEARRQLGSTATGGQT